MSLVTIILIVLILMLIGAVPAWPHSRGWGYGPSGGLGLQGEHAWLIGRDAHELLERRLRGVVSTVPHERLGARQQHREPEGRFLIVSAQQPLPGPQQLGGIGPAPLRCHERPGKQSRGGQQDQQLLVEAIQPQQSRQLDQRLAAVVHAQIDLRHDAGRADSNRPRDCSSPRIRAGESVARQSASLGVALADRPR